MIKRIEHDNNFDLIRLFAAVQVLFIHSVGWLKLPMPSMTFGWVVGSFPGVAIFFCISGFLVTQSFFQCKGNLGDFAVRRALRIYPGLWINYVVILVLLLIGGGLPLADLLRGAFYEWMFGAFALGSDYYGFTLSGYSFNYDSFYKFFPSGVLWTISVELGFYALVPFVFIGVRGRRWLANLSIVLWGVLSLILSMLITTYRQELDSATLDAFRCLPFSYFWIFLIGAAMRVNWDRVAPLLSGKAWFWMPLYYLTVHYDATLRGVSVLQYDWPDFFVVGRMLLLACAVISCAFTLRRAGRVLRGVDLSYGIYLYHMPVVMTLMGFGFLHEVWLYGAVASLTISLALLSWFFVERPCLTRKREVADWLRRLSDRDIVGRQLAKLSWLRTSLGVMASVRPLVPVWSLVLPHRGTLAGSTVWIACVVMTTMVWSHAESQVVTGVKTLAPIYTLDFASRDGWGLLGGAKAVIEDSAVGLAGDTTKYGNQFETVDIATKSGGDYLLTYGIDVEGGGMGIGILDPTSFRWVKTVASIPGSPGVVRFRAPSAKVRVVVFNSNPDQVESQARIHSVVVAPVRH